MKRFLIFLLIVWGCTLAEPNLNPDANTDAIDAIEVVPDVNDTETSFNDLSKDGISDETETKDMGTDQTVDETNPAPVECKGPEYVKTDSGCVKGYIELGNRVFKGIPYAAPPVGKLRWKAPQPVKPWDGVKDATRYSPSCIQFMDGASLGLDQGSGSEDCLYLNVWAPKDIESPLPVLFFIHGGSDAFGTASQPIYEGRWMARRGAVVVTINYRLGLLGFMGHPGLTAEDPNHSSGNYGMLDIIAALKWVKRNIKAFGGDPKNITVFGESAGAINTCVLLFSPLAKGLFQHAILESGTCLYLKDDQKTSDALGKRIAKKLQCAGTSDPVECMRLMSTDQLVTAGSIVYTSELGSLYPHVDGYLLTDTPKNLLKQGIFNVMPVIAGTNRDEGATFTWSMKIDTKTGYQAQMTQYAMYLGLDADQLMQHYPVKDYKNYRDAFNHLITDAIFVCPTRKLLKAIASHGKKAFQYVFNYEYPGSKFGVPHGAELYYVFGTYLKPALQDVETVSSYFMSYWHTFAQSGDPNNDQLQKWEQYTAENKPYLDINTTLKTGKDYRKEQCDFLDTAPRGY